MPAFVQPELCRQPSQGALVLGDVKTKRGEKQRQRVRCLFGVLKRGLEIERRTR